MDNTAITFFKYQGTGNDFVLIDNRLRTFQPGEEIVRSICERRTGVGADGLILLEESETADFRMVYYNSDGRQSTLCGNGGRCIAAFAHRLGLVGEETRFQAIDGIHSARVDGDLVTLFMADVDRVDERYLGHFVDTGSPHYVQVMDDLKGWNVDSQGRRIRYEQFGDEGANVNFVQVLGESRIRVRTYERGVEGETLSCGTGVTAASLALHFQGLVSGNEIEIDTLGGTLYVGYVPGSDGVYRGVYLKGPATMVYEGKIAL